MVSGDGSYFWGRRCSIDFTKIAKVYVKIFELIINKKTTLFLKMGAVFFIAKELKRSS